MNSLEKARGEASEHRSRFLKLHRECCLEFGAYCAAMEKVQSLTGAAFQPGLGGNPAEENELRKLLINEAPMRVLLRNGLEVTKGWGWNLSADVVPLKPKFQHGGEI